MKILLGGSPCTKWSIAQHNRETTCAGEGWELFKNYLIAKELFQPDYFLYENNSSASMEIKTEIEKLLGYKRYNVNSNLFSAQSRARFYITNIPNIEIPEKPCEIYVKDILDKEYSGKFVEKEFVKGKDPKAGKTGLILVGLAGGKNCQGNRVYSIEGKACTLCAGAGGLGAKTGLYLIDNKMRKLTTTEARKLQTIPDWVKFPVSETQIYKQLGNGWTIEVIKNFLKNIPNIENEELTVLSMYDGMGGGYISLKELNCNIKNYISVEIDKFCHKTLDANIPDRLAFKDAFDVRDENSELYKCIMNLR